MIRNPQSTDWPAQSKSRLNQIAKTALWSLLSLIPLWFLSQIFAKMWLWVFTTLLMSQLSNPELDSPIAELNAIYAATAMTFSWAFFLWTMTTLVTWIVVTRHTPLTTNTLPILTLTVTLCVLFATLGFSARHILYLPSPLTPIPSPTPELKAGLSDYASLLAKLDKNLFPPEQYHDLLVRLTDCLPNLTHDFMMEFPDATLSTGETTALLHFITSLAVTTTTTQNPYRNQTAHQALTTVVLNCPFPQ